MRDVLRDGRLRVGGRGLACFIQPDQQTPGFRLTDVERKSNTRSETQPVEQPPSRLREHRPRGSVERDAQQVEIRTRPQAAVSQTADEITDGVGDKKRGQATMLCGSSPNILEFSTVARRNGLLA